MLKKNLVANYLGQGFSGILNLVLLPIYLKIFGMASFGLIGILNISLAWLPIFDFGLSQTVGRQIAAISINQTVELTKIAEKARTNYIKITVAISTAVGAVIYFSSNYLATQWIPPSSIPAKEIEFCIKLMAAILALKVLETPSRSTLLGLQRHVPLNIINTLIILAKGGGIVFLSARFDDSLIFFFAWNLLISAIGTLAFYITSQKLFTSYKSIKNASRSELHSPHTRKTEIYSHQSKLATGITGITILSLCLTQLDKLTLTRLLDLDNLGEYTLASTAAATIFTLALPISTSIYPRLSELYINNKNMEFGKKFLASSQFLTVMCGAWAITLILFAKQAVFAWTGDAQISSTISSLVVILSAGNLLNTFVLIPIQAQVAKGVTSPTITVWVTGVILYIPLLSIIAPKFGPYGCSILWLLINALVLYPGLRNGFLKAQLGSYKNWAINYCFKAILPMLLAAITAKSAYILTLNLMNQTRELNLIFIVLSLFFAFTAGGVSSKLAYHR